MTQELSREYLEGWAPKNQHGSMICLERENFEAMRLMALQSLELREALEMHDLAGHGDWGPLEKYCKERGWDGIVPISNFIVQRRQAALSGGKPL